MHHIFMYFNYEIKLFLHYIKLGTFRAKFGIVDVIIVPDLVVAMKGAYTHRLVID